MSRNSPAKPGGPTRRSAFSLVEAVVSLVVVAVMLAAALSVTTAAKVGQFKLAEGQIAQHLAESMMAEILQQNYQEPSGMGVFGPEIGEPSGARVNFDDVDDYHNWSASPPQHNDGTVMANLAGWRRRVIVERVDPANPSQLMMMETGVKRIRVIVLRNKMKLARFTALRTQAVRP